MLMSSILLEVKIGEDESLEKNFNFALSLVFSQKYLSKIENFIKEKVRIIDSEDKNEKIVAWNINNKIYVNKQIFYSKNKTDQIKFLLHEFIHVLMNKKNIFVIKTFPELQELSKKLLTIVNGNLVQSMSVFLTSEEQKLPSMDRQEIISYLMNGKIDWNALKPEGKKQFIKELQNSGIFNLNSNFWKKRIS